MKMIALRRFHYPSGPSGKDYLPGDEIVLVKESDAKTLRLLKVIGIEETSAPKSDPSPPTSPVVPPTYTTATVAPETAAVEPEANIEPAAEEPPEDHAPRRRYRRRDIRAEGESE
jgi:hypothetical protein